MSRSKEMRLIRESARLEANRQAQEPKPRIAVVEGEAHATVADFERSQFCKDMPTTGLFKLISNKADKYAA